MKCVINLSTSLPQYIKQQAIGAPFPVSCPFSRKRSLVSYKKHIASACPKINFFQCPVFGATGIKAIISESYFYETPHILPTNL